MIRPRIKIPLWAVLAIAGTAYLARGFLRRGGDLSPDLPGDAVVFGIVIAVMVMTWVLRVQNAREKRRAHAAEEHEGERSRSSQQG